MFERLWALRWKSPSSRFVFVVELKQETLTPGRLRERCKDWMLPCRPQDRDISNYDVQRTTCILLIFIDGCAIIKLWNLQNCLASGEIYLHDMHDYDNLVVILAFLLFVWDNHPFAFPHVVSFASGFLIKHHSFAASLSGRERCFAEIYLRQSRSDVVCLEQISRWCLFGISSFKTIDTRYGSECAT